MTILHLKFALIKERCSYDNFVHDGFVPVLVNLDVYTGVVTNTIKRLCPQLNSHTRLFVTGKLFKKLRTDKIKVANFT